MHGRYPSELFPATGVEMFDESTDVCSTSSLDLFICKSDQWSISTQLPADFHIGVIERTGCVERQAS